MIDDQLQILLGRLKSCQLRLQEAGLGGPVLLALLPEMRTTLNDVAEILWDGGNASDNLWLWRVQEVLVRAVSAVDSSIASPIAAEERLAYAIELCEGQNMSELDDTEAVTIQVSRAHLALLDAVVAFYRVRTEESTAPMQRWEKAIEALYSSARFGTPECKDAEIACQNPPGWFERVNDSRRAMERAAARALTQGRAPHGIRFS